VATIAGTAGPVSLLVSVVDAQLVQDLLEGGPAGADAAGGLGEQFPIAAGTLQGVDLKCRS
jgi:hypothetical protein